MTVTHGDLTLDWLGYATLRIETSDGFVAYLDPGRYGVLTGEWTPDTEGIAHPEGTDYDARDGDLVCVTHDHHYDSDGIQRVAREDATVVVYEGVDTASIDRDVLPVDDLPYDVRRVETGEQLGFTAEVRALPAHNHSDGPNTSANGTPFHPEGFGCGYLLSFGESSVLWPGDSDALDEHASLTPTVFSPPIGRSFTMDRHDAADLATQLDPELVLPIHYNTFAALEADSGAFAADVAQSGIPVVLDEI
jgi:L-ascorbate metabolism protein UlaG (beta-lactamase superfamily)